MEVLEKDQNKRLDLYLSEELNLSRAKIQKLIKDEQVLVNDKVEKSSYEVKVTDNIEVDSDLNYDIKVEPKNITLDIVYEDPYLLVINKKSGMVVHPAPGHYEDTMVNALLYKFGKSATTNLRPGIVHRLDKDTSGLMLVAKDDKTMELLGDMISKKEVSRHYLAIVDGIIKEDAGKIDAPIGRDPNNRQKMIVTDINAKDAITNFKVLKRFSNNTLVECILDTGRTHQIRVHMAYIKHPVTNDPVYGKCSDPSFAQMLHSYSIEFIHPITNKKLFFKIDPPKEFTTKLKELEND
jgi:23S rRNA pseudouridine1911/1915/1917 synthase